MLKQHGYETFHRTERRTVYHDRTVLLVIASRIFEFESFRKVVIHLYCTQLPLPSDGVLYHEIQFRPVKCRLAVFYDCLESFFVSRFNNRPFGFFPVFIRTDVFVPVIRIAEGNLGHIFVEVKCFENIKHYVDYLAELFLQLVRTAENMRIVLRKSAHSRKPVEFAALLITVNRAEFGQSQRKILVRPRLGSVNLAVVRAVHRLEKEFLSFLRSCNRTERILAVFCIMA